MIRMTSVPRTRFCLLMRVTDRHTFLTHRPPDPLMHVFFLGDVMNLLFKREQTDSAIGKVTFRLWAKTELDEEETHLVERYHFDSAKLIDALQPNLLRNSIAIGVVVFLLGATLLGGLGMQLALLFGAILGAAASYFYYDRHRETVMVRDLIHGRHFTCDSVVDLARKEAWLAMVVSFLRQVMESAKNWDGTETIPVEALTKQETKFIVVKGL